MRFLWSSSFSIQPWGLFDRYCIKSKVPKQLKGSIWDKYPLQIILIISGRDKVPLTSLVHPMVSADCNSSVYEVFNGLPRRFWGAWNSSFIPTRYLVAEFALEIIMRLRTQPHVMNEVILVDVVLTRLIFNAYNYINLEASGPRPRLISYMCIPNGAQVLWKKTADFYRNRASSKRPIAGLATRYTSWLHLHRNLDASGACYSFPYDFSFSWPWYSICI